MIKEIRFNMNVEPFISVILPIYNIEKYLDKCMNSVLNQTYSNLEIIMVDDGSTDNCPILCDYYKKKDKRVVVFHKENGGLSDARNYGIERAKGEYITCIDPDDYVDLDYIEYLLSLLKKYKTDMAIAQHRVHYDNGDIKEKGKSGDEDIPTEICLERLLYHDVIDTSAWGKLYHKSLFDNVKYPKGKIFEDIGTTYNLMIQCDHIAVGYESKYNYVFHNNSIVNSRFKPNKMDLIEMTDKMGKDVLQKFPRLKDAVLRRRVYSRISTLNQMINVEGYQKERRELIDYIKSCRRSVLMNSRTPKRDKIAIILLSINYQLYRFFWLLYQNYIMTEK